MSTNIFQNIKNSIKNNFITLMIFLFICGASMEQIYANERPDVANHVIAYDGAQGIKVWTLRIGDRSANEALVQIEDIDHEWNLKIQKMQVEKTSRDTRYYIDINGNKFVVLIIKDKCCGDLYLPGESQSVYISYSKELSNEGNAQAFLTDYLKTQD